MGRKTHIKNEEKLKTYLAKVNDTQSGNKKDKNNCAGAPANKKV